MAEHEKSSLDNILKLSIMTVLTGLTFAIANPVIKNSFDYIKKLDEVYKESKVIVVDKGDYLDKFAKQYTKDCNCGLDYRDVTGRIIKENYLKDSTIYAGQELKIPVYKLELRWGRLLTELEKIYLTY